MQNNFENKDNTIQVNEERNYDSTLHHISEDMQEENTIQNKKLKKNKKNRTLSGFAVLEGVTVYEQQYIATAVRDPENIIQIENREVHPKRILTLLKGIFFLRGILYFFINFFIVTKHLYRSTEMSIDDSNNSKFNKWMEDKLKINISSTLTFLFLILLITLAIVVFAWVPIILADKIVELNWQWFHIKSVPYYLFLATIRLIIFLFYILILSLLPTIKRIMQYLGAQHKTINCVKDKNEVTVKNVMHSSRYLENCPINFLYLTVVAGIVVFPILDIFLPNLFINIKSNILIVFLNISLHILAIPILASIVYEPIQLFALSNSKFLLVFKSPNYLMQFLTVKEPDEDMIAVAIAAYKTVKDMTNGKEVQLTKFIFSRSVRQYLKDLKERFALKNIDESDAEWLISIKTDIPRSELIESRAILMPSKIKQLEGFVSARLDGKPLWYVLGSTSFYGSEFLVDERVLIPRPETELLVEQVIKTIDKGNKVLDLCTGSGCIAVTIAKECRHLNLTVTAADISADALQLAQKNANLNGTNITFVESNMFENIQGQFDVIICNPPYIKHEDIAKLQPEIKNYEPILALDGGVTGLDFYRILAQEAHKYLTPNGTLLLECGEGQTEEIVKMLENFEFKIIIRDLNGIDRFIRAML